MASCLEHLQNYLRANRARFEIHAHPPSFSAQAQAAAVHEAGAHVAKTVIARVDERLIMLILPAPAQVDFEQVRQLLHAQSAGPAAEAEFAGLFTDCELGAMPPFGHLYGMPAYLDRTLIRTETILFPAGDHQTALKVATADYLRIAAPTVVALSHAAPD